MVNIQSGQKPLSNYLPLLKTCKNVFNLEIKGKYRVCTMVKKCSSNFLENRGKLISYPSPLKKIVWDLVVQCQGVRYELRISLDLYGNLDIFIHFITQDRCIWGSASYSFSDSLRLVKQFDSISRKLEQLYMLNPVQNVEFNLDLQSPVTWES